MNIPIPTMRRLARELLNATLAPSDPQGHASANLFEGLRISLTELVGATGFRSLMQAALAQTASKAPALLSVTLSNEGRLGGLDKVDVDVAHELLTDLLELLVEFVGEKFTRAQVSKAMLRA